MIEQAQVGALAMARIASVRWGRSCANSTSSTCPSCSATTPMEKVIDGPIGDEFLKKLSDHPG